MTAPRLAIIAGAGALPLALSQAVTAMGAPAPFVAAMAGFLPQGLTPDLEFRLERLVPFIQALLDRGICEVVFAGAIRRPRLDPSLFDPATAAMVPRIMGAMAKGDDGALREAIAVIEEAGLAVRGVPEVAPHLVPEAGILCGLPSAAAERDLSRARAIHLALAGVDVGQGCVVAQGQCLAVEALPGTDAMLAEVARIPAAIRPSGGVFFKAPKAGQERRIDLPVLGPATVQGAIAAGLEGIAFEAGGVICLEMARMRDLAAGAGIFLWAV